MAWPQLLFLMLASARTTTCEIDIAGSCPDAGLSDAYGLIQTRTQVAHEQEEHAYKVTHFGRSYVVSSRPDVALKAAFDDIADNNVWGSQESVSGLGSELAMTAPVRKCLGNWIQKYNVKVFVDVPCGDANWQAHIPGLDRVKYKGYDIADKPLRNARTKNADQPSMSFGQMDMTSEVPPEKADIILVRDVIQHLPLGKGRQMLLNAKRSGARYLAVSTYSDGNNTDIPAGAFYRDDVHAAPFNLPLNVETCGNYAQSLADYRASHLELFDLSAWTPSD